MARHPVGLGTHVRLDHRIHDGNAELSTGRTLRHSLQRLDGKRRRTATAYATAWLEELDDINMWTFAECDRDGVWRLRVGFPCDGQEIARRERFDRLAQHLDSTPGARDAVIEALQIQGRRHDNRDVGTRDLFAALRSFLATGGAVTIDPDGRIATRADNVLIFDQGDRVAGDAAAEMTRVFGRWRSHRRLARIVRSLGVTTPNGWLLLEARS